MEKSKQKTWADKDRKDAFVHELKVLGHQVRRACTNLPNIQRWPQSPKSDTSLPFSEITSKLWQDVPQEEWLLEAGKVANVRLASECLKGIEIPAGDTFSFWAHVGRPIASRGFVLGREVRAGCVIPTIAGGLCLLSNALYAAALEAGLEIVERHGHTRKIFDEGRSKPDATVFWNYVDLRFRSEKPWRLEVDLDENNLNVRIFVEGVRSRAPEALDDVEAGNQLPKLLHKSCWSCEVQDCRHYSVHEARGARRALLLDSSWPEFSDWVSENLRPDDLVFLPVDGRKRGIRRYSWALSDLQVVEVPLAFLARSLTARIFRTQGPEMRQVQLRMDEILAQSMSRMLPVEITELVVSQHLLVHLHRHGSLGGRAYDVLATRPSLAKTQERLDLASARWPHRRSLADFRVDEGLVQAEREALKQARKVVSPNLWLAEEYGLRSERISWSLDSRVPKVGNFERTRPVIHFPGSTIARLGVCSLREALRGLDVELQISGSNLEEDHFWEDVVLGENQGIASADLVVCPAWLPHNPRNLLRAISLGIPIIVSEVFGLGALDGVIEVPCGDANALRKAILRSLGLASDRALAR